MIIRRQTGQKSLRNQGYTLAEVMIAVLVMALIMLSVYGLLNSGFGTISVTREEERAVQIMTQKLEAIRLLTWPQLSNCPTTFQETYNPQGTNGTAGVTYYGTLATTNTATNLPSGYQGAVHLITVSVTWTNNIRNTASVGHTRQMQTLSALNGLQNYIFGSSP